MRRKIRKAFKTLMPTDDTFEAFCIDNQWESHLSARSSIEDKYNSLLKAVTERAIITALERDFPDKVGEFDFSTSIVSLADLDPAILVLSGTQNDRVRHSEHLQDCPSLVARLWGNPRDVRGIGGRQDAVLAYDVDNAPDLTNSFLRLALHGGLDLLAVDNPVLWQMRLENLSHKCIGTSSKTWRPGSATSSATEQSGWSLESSPISQGVESPRAAFDADNTTLAQSLSSAMDAWVIERMDATLALIFEGDTSVLQIEIGTSFRTQMKATWKTWRRLVDDKNLLRHMIASTMISDEDSEQTGLLRAGPRTLYACLLPATVFALALEVAMACQLAPSRATVPANFTLSQLDTHLVGLELIRGIQLSQKSREINWRTGIVLLTHERTPASALSNWRRLGEPEGAAKSFAHATGDNVAIITQDTEFIRLLKYEPHLLRQYLLAQLLAPREDGPASPLSRVLRKGSSNGE